MITASTAGFKVPRRDAYAMESLLADFVLTQQNARRDHQRVADTCATDWNTVHASIGSFADEHSTL
jgi:antitoxin CcdA